MIIGIVSPEFPRNWVLKRVTVKIRAEVGLAEEPDAGKPHVCGAPGDRRSYHEIQKHRGGRRNEEKITKN
jgi:hypothetical protein